MRGTAPALEFLRSRPGLAASAAALAAQSLLRLAMPAAFFAPYAVADRLVRVTPGGVATAAIDALGHRALSALGAGVIIATLALGYALARQTPLVLGGLAFALSLLAGLLDPVSRDRPDLLVSSAAAAAAALGAAQAFAMPAPAGSTTPDARRRQLVAAGALVRMDVPALIPGQMISARLCRVLILSAQAVVEAFREEA